MEWKCFAEKKKHHHSGSGVPTATISLESGPLVHPLTPPQSHLYEFFACTFFHILAIFKRAFPYLIPDQEGRYSFYSFGGCGCSLRGDTSWCGFGRIVCVCVCLCMYIGLRARRGGLMGKGWKEGGQSGRGDR